MVLVIYIKRRIDAPNEGQRTFKVKEELMFTMKVKAPSSSFNLFPKENSKVGAESEGQQWPGPQ